MLTVDVPRGLFQRVNWWKKPKRKFLMRDWGIFCERINSEERKSQVVWPWRSDGARVSIHGRLLSVKHLICAWGLTLFIHEKIYKIWRTFWQSVKRNQKRTLPYTFISIGHGTTEFQCTMAMLDRPALYGTIALSRYQLQKYSSCPGNEWYFPISALAHIQSL